MAGDFPNCRGKLRLTRYQGILGRATPAAVTTKYLLYLRYLGT